MLKTCFTNNPHGAGFMYSDGLNVHIRKGFMTFDAFYTALTAEIKHPKKTAVVMHFRIQTQGGTQPALTHPYPLTSNIDVMRKLSVRCTIGIAHNGIIDATSDGAKNYNDTMRYIADYLTLIIHDKNYYKNYAVLDMITSTIDYSRLAIMDGTGHIQHIGHGWTYDKSNGLAFSNTSYKPYEYKSYKGGYYGHYYDDYDYYDEYYKTDAKTNASDLQKYVASNDNECCAFVKYDGVERYEIDGDILEQHIYSLYDVDGDIIDCYGDSEKIQDASDVVRAYNKSVKTPITEVTCGAQWY